ncbi:transcription elongation factor SPT5-like isoform X2 [Clavelina lepadiformis]|uniref:Transcription elongation factor SPT5 n=1 Tax=Clavelina lepadiformis TaxID=159417 RepID=A0ABP0GU39_CLALP
MSDSDLSSDYSEEEEDHDDGYSRKHTFEVDSEAEEVDDRDASDGEPGSDPPSDEAEDLDDKKDEDEDEYDEEEYEDLRPPKRQKHGGFIIDEADVDDDDDGGDEEEWEEGAEDILDRASNAEHAIESDMSGARRLQNMIRDQEEEELGEYYMRKYASVNSRSGDNAYGDDVVLDEISQQQLLPDVKDPNLWTVKCKIGEERATVILLMRKFIAMQYEEQPLQIKSVSSPEGLKGYIYVEAIKQSHVKQAIEGVSNLRLGYWSQKMVPTKEMPDVFKVLKEFDRGSLKPKMWVRLKKGLYKGDLAQIDYLEQSSNQVTLKLIPRIDLTRPRGANRNNQDRDRKRLFKRPPQKLFDREDINFSRTEVPQIIKDGDFLIFEGNRFSQKGFLYKNFNLNAILVEGVKPTLAELEKFEDQPEGLDIQLVTDTTLKSEKVNRFIPGDNVIVSEGELANLLGKVISVDGNKVMMLPKHEDFTDPLEFLATDLQKHFTMGDHVKVISGRYEGDTGLIVQVDDNLVVLFSDVAKQELKLLPRDLQLCADVSSGVDAVGKFQFGDLVLLDNQTVGVIVCLEKEIFQILTMHGKRKPYKHQAVTRRKDTRFAMALDAEQNSVQCRDIVKVVDGPHTGQEGEIKHLYRGFAFLQSKKVIENGGFFVAKAKQLVLAGSARPNATGVGSFAPMSPRIGSPARQDTGNRGGGGGGGGGGGSAGRGRGRGQRDMGIIGQTVRVRQGPYKGHIGVVKDATESTARVELHATCQTINVDRSRLQPTDQRRPGAGGRTSSYATTPLYGSQTPMYGAGGSRTPMYGSQTPVHEGNRTPHYGSQTPLQDGSRTPRGAGSAWDPTNPNTPARPDNFDYDTASPAPYGAATPNPQTPGGYQSEGYHSEDASPQAPYSNPPQTPGGYASDRTYSPYGGPTPSPASYDASPSPGFAAYQPTPSPGMPNPSPRSSGFQPSPGTYQPSPSPGSYQISPGSGYQPTPSPLDYTSPLTPGGGNPSPLSSYGTPGSVSSVLDHVMNTEWQTVDIVVKVKQSHEDGSGTLTGKTGVIRTITGGLCNVYIDEIGRTVSVPGNNLEPVLPGKNDKVKVILGEDRETTGELISIDDKDGIVRMDHDNQLKILQLRFLGKISTDQDDGADGSDNDD